MWVTEKQFAAGLEDKLFTEVQAWVKAKWPFTQVA